MGNKYGYTKKGKVYRKASRPGRKLSRHIKRELLDQAEQRDTYAERKNQP